MFFKKCSHLLYNVQIITGINCSTSGSQFYCEKTDVEANLKNIKITHFRSLQRIMIEDDKITTKTVQTHEQMWCARWSYGRFAMNFHIVYLS